jgi:hypothetical protein
MREGSALLEGEFIRQRDEPARVHHDFFCIGARLTCECDPIRHPNIACSVADGSHDARAFDIGDERHRTRIKPAPLCDVHEIDPSRVDAHQRLSRAGNSRPGDLLQFENLRAAMSCDANCFHRTACHPPAKHP